MTADDWASRYGDAQEYAWVVIDGHTWFSLSSVEIHVWVQKPGKSRIDLDSLSEDGYASGVCPHFMYQWFNTDDNIICSHCQSLYPIVDLDDVDNAFWCGLELIKATILRLNMPGVNLNGWVFPTPIVEPEHYLGVLMDGAWVMAYN